MYNRFFACDMAEYMVDSRVFSEWIHMVLSPKRNKATNNSSNLMKKVFTSAALAVSAFVLSSCGAPLIGAVYTDITVPVTATSSSASSKVGTATSTTYLGLWAEGDASIAAAKKNGGISTVSSVDEKIKSILGIITTYTTTVRGN